MEFKAELLNVIKYERKTDKSIRTMISYRLLDPKALQTESTKFKGYAVLNAYFDGVEVFDKIPDKYCGSACDFVMKKEVSTYDPTKEFSKLVKINDIDLV